MPIYTYRFSTHWTTTDQELIDYIQRYEVSPEESLEIKSGTSPDVVLEIIDPVE